jgi:hypothetical protein
VKRWTTNLHPSTSTNLALKKPATLHSSASANILWRTLVSEGEAPSKTISLWCLHKHQQTMTMPIQQSPALARLQPVHKIWVQGRQPILCVPPAQKTPTSVERTHPSRIWEMDSGAWSQKGHTTGRGIPRRASQSSVQHQLVTPTKGRIYTWCALVIAPLGLGMYCNFFLAFPFK